MFKNKKIVGIAAVVLALMTVVSATFAWFTFKDEAVNHLEADQWTNGSVQIVEVFDETNPLDPGCEVNKDVWVINTGNADALVRISFAEAFQKLVADANGDAISKDHTASWVDTFKDGGKDTIPKVMSIKNYTTTNGWLPLVAGTAPFNGASGITVTGYTNAATNGYTILYKEFSSGTGAPKTYSFVAYKTLTATGTIYDYDMTNNPVAQVVNVKITYDKITNRSAPTLKIETPAYPYFTRDDKVLKKWADLTNFTDLVGYTKSLPIAADLIGTSPAVDAMLAQTDKLIRLIFSSNVTTNLATATIGKWWYNTVDGYFYYIGKIAAAGSTSQLLDSVLLSNTAGNAYSSLKFDLTVKMDGIQAVKEAADTWDTTFGSRLAALGVFA